MYNESAKKLKSTSVTLSDPYGCYRSVLGACLPSPPVFEQEWIQGDIQLTFLIGSVRSSDVT